ncbi:MAG: hypothetical protein ACYC7I_13210, partial [Gammaproteobacteria bacterium]
EKSRKRLGSVRPDFIAVEGQPSGERPDLKAHFWPQILIRKGRRIADIQRMMIINRQFTVADWRDSLRNSCQQSSLCEALV